MSDYSIRELDRIYRKELMRLNKFMIFRRKEKLSKYEDQMVRIRAIIENIKRDKKIFEKQVRGSMQEAIVLKAARDYKETYEKGINEIRRIFNEEVLADMKNQGQEFDYEEKSM